MAARSTDEIGVGSALRRAREKRRLTLEEASRDTKLPVKQLSALEEERFDALLGDVYVRGSLRTYAQYLGLSPEKVATAYARRAEEPQPPPPPAKLGAVERAIAATRIRDNQRLMVVLAAVVIVIAVVFGLLSRASSVPPPATLPTTAAPAVAADGAVQVALIASHATNVTYTLDDAEPQTVSIMKGETRSFSADQRLTIRVANGGAVKVTVDGVDLGTPGQPGKPWHATYGLGEVPPSPSA